MGMWLSHVGASFSCC